MNHIGELRNIRTPQAWKERLDIKISQGKPAVKSVFRKFPVILAAVLAIAVLLAGTALAYALTGGEFFTKLFLQKAGTADYSYMDVSQLTELAGRTIGTVVDTDELRIDVTDVISSGSDAMVALCVTAKQLDSVLLYTGWDEVPLNNYRFGAEDGTLFNNMETYSFEYIYSDEDDSLAANQFYLVLTVTSLDGFKDSPYSINLQSFGYYDLLAADGTGGGITAIYEGPWTITLDLNADADHSRIIFLNRRIDLGQYKYTIKDVYLTPFSCTAVIAYDGAPDLSSDRFDEFADAASDLALHVEDGTPVKHRPAYVTTGGYGYPDSTYHITIDFEVPIKVEDVLSLRIFGRDYNISAVFSDIVGDTLAAPPEPGTAETVVPESPSYTTEWTDKKKYDFYNKMRRSIDYYDYASGTLTVSFDGGDAYDVSYRVNLLTGEAQEDVTDEAGHTIELDSSDGEAVYYSLLSQGLATKYLPIEENWYFSGSANMCGRSCTAIRGTAHDSAADGTPRTVTFEMLVDLETGVILQYLSWDTAGNFIDVCVSKSISYDYPGTFSK